MCPMYTIYTAIMADAHWPLAPVANEQWLLLLYKSYTSDTHGVKAFQSYTAKQRYTVYSYTSLYTIHPLHHPSDPERVSICVSAGTNRSRQGAQESREHSNRHVSKKANNKTPTCPAVADCCRQGRQSRALFANNHQIGDETLVTRVPVPGDIGS